MDINTLLIVLVVLILVALVAHGIWSNRREKVQMFKSSKTFTHDARQPQQDISNPQPPIEEDEIPQAAQDMAVSESPKEPLSDEQVLEKIKISIPNAKAPLANTEPSTTENSNINRSIDELTTSPEFDEEEGVSVSSQQIRQELDRQRHQQENSLTNKVSKENEMNKESDVKEQSQNENISNQPIESTDSETALEDSKANAEQTDEQNSEETISSQPLYPMNSKEWQDKAEQQNNPNSNQAQSQKSQTANTTKNSDSQNESSKKKAQPGFVILYIVARNRRSFMGANIVQLMDTLGFIYGEHNIYHRHLDLSDASPILFSVANMLKPGTFPIQNMFDFKTEGLTLFMNTPSPGKDDVNFKLMLKAAETIAQNLDGFLLNDKREEFTEEVKEEYLTRLK